MHFNRHFFVGILLFASVSFVNAEESTTTVIVTSTVDPTATSTLGSSETAGTGSTTLGPSTTVTAGTAGTGSTTLGPSTTVTAGTAGTGSTANGGSSAAPVSTTGGPTTTPGTTTLPNVTVNYVQFGLLQCDDTVCTYQFDTPKNDQMFLATENSIVGEDRIQYNSLKEHADSIDKKITTANDDAKAKIQKLNDMLNDIQKNLDSIKSNIDAIQKAQTSAIANLLVVEQFLGQVSQAPDNCLYLQCFRPTTPTQPITTPTPKPTSPPSPCATFSCPTTEEGSNGTEYCALDPFNRPYCTNCDGDLDGYTHCETAACSPSGTNLVLNKDGGATFWYSFGYNKTLGNSSVVTPNSNCVYNFNLTGIATGFQLGDTPSFDLTCLSDSVTLSVISDGLTTSFSRGMKARQVNSVLNSVNIIGKFVFNSAPTSSPTQGYCYLQMVPYSTPSAISPPSTKKSDGDEIYEQPKPANGFFGWLMGY